MFFRRSRHIASLAVALGLAQGGWESCDGLITQVAFPATPQNAAISETGQAAQAPLFGSKAVRSSFVDVRHARAATSRHTGHSTRHRRPPGTQKALPRQTPSQFFGREPARTPEALRLIADLNWSDIRSPAGQGTNEEPQPSVDASAREAIPTEPEGRDRAAVERITQRHQEAIRREVERIAQEQEQINQRESARIAREQSVRDRDTAERIARQQQEANNRAVERITREQTEINKREGARIAREQQARDLAAVERIKRRQLTADRQAIKSILKADPETDPVDVNGNDASRNLAGRRFLMKLRSIGARRVTGALRKTGSVLGRARVPRYGRRSSDAPARAGRRRPGTDHARRRNER